MINEPQKIEPERPQPDLSGAALVRGAVNILEQIETLPADATGAIRFGSSGVVLVESRQICWAAAPQMQNRLTEILRHQRTPPLDRSMLDRVFRECQRTGTPVGEALLASGHVTSEGLRSALLTQTTEAITHIARSHDARHDFVPHVNSRYDARFVFSSSEVLASVGASQDMALAAVAGHHLSEMLVPEAAGFAFTRARGRALPSVLAVQRLRRVGVSEVLAVSMWSSSLFEVNELMDPTVAILAASWRDHGAVVTWRTRGIHFVAICPAHSASARLIARLEAELLRREEVAR